MESENLQLNSIYKYDPVDDKIEFTAISCNKLNTIANMKGLSYRQIIEEINNRQEYLEENMKKDVSNIDNVQLIINRYYEM